MSSRAIVVFAAWLSSGCAAHTLMLLQHKSHLGAKGVIACSHRAHLQAKRAIVSSGTPQGVDPSEFRDFSRAIKPLLDKVVDYRDTVESLDEDEKAARRAEIVELYQAVFVPASAFALANLGIYMVVIGLIFSALQLSGVGYEQAVEALLRATDSVPWVANTAGKLDPALGNLALALLGVELAGPVILAASAALTPAVATALRAWLATNGLDSQGASERLEEYIRSWKN
mmetsp:Transcript_28215/g.82878  ORF Transcript_28215/g.82878 Transcript_28215/m.82878 type:complete len:229 (+) Transcript_28215:3-689(+)